jgi:lysophospholipase L1-like esterase
VQPLQPPGEWTRYAALGDSFTEGLDDEIGPGGRHRGWADMVALTLADRARQQGLGGIDYANLAIRGRLIDHVVREQVPAAVELRPDLASIAVGVNDALRRRFDLNAAATSLESGVRALRGGGSDVLLFAFGNPSRRSRVMGLIADRIRAYNSAVDAIAEAYGCRIVHFWDVAVMDDDRLWSQDRLHLSPAGHRLAAEGALEALGVGGSAWRTPLVPDPRPPLRSRVASDVGWMREHLAPWLARRARGTSSGEGIAPKHATWVRVSGGPWVAPEMAPK